MITRLLILFAWIVPCSCIAHQRPFVNNSNVFAEKKETAISPVNAELKLSQLYKLGVLNDDPLNRVMNPGDFFYGNIDYKIFNRKTDTKYLIKFTLGNQKRSCKGFPTYNATGTDSTIYFSFRMKAKDFCSFKSNDDINLYITLHELSRGLPIVNQFKIKFTRGSIKLDPIQKRNDEGTPDTLVRIWEDNYFFDGKNGLSFYNGISGQLTKPTVYTRGEKPIYLDKGYVQFHHGMLIKSATLSKSYTCLKFSDSVRFSPGYTLFDQCGEVVYGTLDHPYTIVIGSRTFNLPKGARLSSNKFNKNNYSSISFIEPFDFKMEDQVFYLDSGDYVNFDKKGRVKTINTNKKVMVEIGTKMYEFWGGEFQTGSIYFDTLGHCIGGKMVTPQDILINGKYYKMNSGSDVFIFYPNGHLKKGLMVAENIYANLQGENYPLLTGPMAQFDDNGELLYGNITKPAWIIYRGNKFRISPVSRTHNSIWMMEPGIMFHCTLYEDTYLTLAGKSFKFKGGEELDFNKDGDFFRGELAAGNYVVVNGTNVFLEEGKDVFYNYEKKYWRGTCANTVKIKINSGTNRTYTKGTSIEFDINGNLIR